MGLARLHLRFWILLGLLGLACVGGGWWCGHARNAWLRAHRQLAAKQRESRSLRRHASAQAANPGGERIALELARAEETRHRLRSVMGDEAGEKGEPSEWRSPVNRTEAFLELSEFAAHFRERARLLGVEVRPGECFGFATYARTGPELENLAMVHRQCVVLQRLLTLLLESRPTGILAAQRGHPPDLNGAGEGVGAEDFFAMDAARTAATPGMADALAFRLRFTGGTRVLRDFLNRVRQDELPLLVRLVEAQTLVTPAGGRQDTETSGLSLAPHAMQFTVTVEHLRLLTSDAPRS